MYTLPNIPWGSDTATAHPMEIRDTMQIYTLNYTSIGRKLEITFEKAYPHIILGWQEAMQLRGRWKTTAARKTHAIKLDYWRKNSAEDVAYREQLGLK